MNKRQKTKAKPPMNILVISTEEYLTLRLLKCLAALDAEVSVLGDGACPVVQASRHCRRYDSFERPGLSAAPEQLHAEINRYCDRHRIDVILPSGMAGSFLLASLTEGFHARVLPMASGEQLRILNNKWSFARLLKQHGLPFPESRLIGRLEDVEALDIDFPVIIKPLELDAGRGVARCDSRSSLAAHVLRHRESLPLLVQEYIPGTDVGLGLLAHRGTVLAWTIQKQLADGSGVEFIEQEQVLEIGRQIAAVCQYDGILHFDLRMDARDGSVKVLECNPRFWASLPFCMVAGVNFADLGVRLALGKPLPPVAYRTVALTFPTKVLAGAIRGRASCWRMPEPSRRALQFTLSDPLPYVCLGVGRIRRKMLSFFPQNSLQDSLAASDRLRRI